MFRPPRAGAAADADDHSALRAGGAWHCRYHEVVVPPRLGDGAAPASRSRVVATRTIEAWRPKVAANHPQIAIPRADCAA
jgi:hypothetical protein